MFNTRSLIFTLAFFFFSCQHQNNIPGDRHYQHPFSPLPGMVSSEELPYRDELCLNGQWSFMPVYGNDIGAFKLPGQFSWDPVKIRIPSPWNVNSFASGDGGDFRTFPSYPKAWENATIGWMKRELVLPESWSKKIITLHFEAIAGLSRIYINGKLAGENLDLFFPTEIDATPFITKGKNEILVGVAKASLTDTPGKYGRRSYVAGSFWGQHIAGIWQDVFLLARPELSIEDVFVQPDIVHDELNIAVTIRNHTDQPQVIHTEATVRSWKKGQSQSIHDLPSGEGTLGAEVLNFAGPAKIDLSPGAMTTIMLKQKVDGQLDYWTPDHPNLYGVTVELGTRNNIVIDRKHARFGWRQFSIDGAQLLLNGKPVVLRGDSWHFMGIPQMTRRYAWGWFQMLKDANANAVRLHAQPYPSFYMDMADEMGICVLDETGIWSSDGGPKMDSEDYWTRCKEHVKNLVMRDRNHPSVFGWSVCNETLPVAIHVFHAPESIVQRQIDEINKWVSIVSDTDPTRPWISGDGETMRPTTLPVVVGHYGDEHSLKEWSSQQKPWGVGETGMAYYGTPRQVAAINGDRAYESQQGRMEGLAKEAYDLIGKQNNYHASYTSVFNLVWYGLKPLEFGMTDTTSAPNLTDGIFFPAFREGVPGVQPERIGPYASTINPGYDPRLPLYEPWPLFNAVKAANTGQPYYTPDRSQAKKVIAKVMSTGTAVSAASTVRIIAPEKSTVAQELRGLGIEATADGDAQVLIVDVGNERMTGQQKTAIDNTLQRNGHVIFFNIKPENISILNEVLSSRIALVERTATSFVIGEHDKLTEGLTNRSFYFSEAVKAPVMSYAFTGEAIGHGAVLLHACNTDWTRWNYKGEDVKTAAVLKSERERKSPGNAIVRIDRDKGSIYLVAPDLFALKGDGQEIIKSMLINLGTGFRDVSLKDQHALSETCQLERAVARREESNESAATIVRANAQGVLRLGSDQGRVRSLSFWLFSPRSLANLLAEPDMPALRMKAEGKRELTLIINDKPVSSASNDGETVFSNLPLEKGWNYLEIKIPASDHGDPGVKIIFDSNKTEFLNQLRSAVDR